MGGLASRKTIGKEEKVRPLRGGAFMGEGITKETKKTSGEVGYSS